MSGLNLRCTPLLETLELRGSPSTLFSLVDDLTEVAPGVTERPDEPELSPAAAPADRRIDTEYPSVPLLQESSSAGSGVTAGSWPLFTQDAGEALRRAAAVQPAGEQGGGSTLGEPEDDSPPVVYLSFPQTGDEVSGPSAEFFGNGYDDVATVYAEFYVDYYLEWAEYDNPKDPGHYHYGGAHNSWDTTIYENGPHVLMLVVYDNEYQPGYSEEVIVIVNNKG